ncbi:MAG TPA: NfeD family protein [Ignavibacteriaceae bacterium]|nr:NfeD family protein [Ignavibacteriaceae bacterium]
MKKLFYIFLFYFISINAQTKVYVADITGEIDLGLTPFVSRIIDEANKGNADAIIFRINTFGGRVDAATEIKDAILTSKVPTYAFINNRAISAGALIALSCQYIVMVPGSSMGAVTVVDQVGQKQSEKYQSYMRSEMRSTAERRGRRSDIAEGMVDEKIVVSGIKDDSTKLVTLTSNEAYEFKYADTVVSSLNDLLKAYNLDKAELVYEKSNWAEDFVRFLNNPIVSSILIMIGFLGIMAEIKTAGWGMAGTVAIIALALFFGSSYILNLASIMEILIFVVGIILLAVEIFVIPGFGFTGIAGVILIIISIFLALVGSIPVWDLSLISTPLLQIASALFFSLIFIFIIARFLPKSKTFNKLVLSTEETSVDGFVTHSEFSHFLDAEGVAISTLRPAGIAEIDGNRLDVVTQGEYIEKGEKIKVIKVEGFRIIVKVV